MSPDMAMPPPSQDAASSLLKPRSRWVVCFAAALHTGLRSSTYLFLLLVFALVGKIFWEGGKTLLEAQWPFINLSFLLDSPESLHVFTYEHMEYTLGDRAFQAFLIEQEIQPSELQVDAYPYAAGGIFPAIVGTAFLGIGSMAIALVLGMGAAIYLNEFASSGRFIRMVRMAIGHLAEVPSIVYGLFGMGMFVFFLGWGQSLLAGCFTLAFMVLPVVIANSEAALRAVPYEYRQAGFALGATRWTTVRLHVLPHALPGMLSSAVHGMIRVVGETAPILFTAAYAMRDRLPWQVNGVGDFLTQGVMALPFHVYLLASKLPHNEYTAPAQYGTAAVLLSMVGLLVILSACIRRWQHAPKSYPNDA